MASSSRPPGPFARFFFGRIFPLIFLLTGLGMLVFGSTDLIRGKQSETWPQASGMILSSTVRSHSGSKGGTTYGAEVSYSYEVAGTRFVSKKVSFGEYSSSDGSHAADIVNRYPEGRKVVVRYDPAEPSRAVIEPGVNGGIFIPVGIGAVFAVAGIAMAIFMPRALRKQAEQEASDATGAPFEIPESATLQTDHPRVTCEAGLDSTTFTTSGRNMFGWILLFIGGAQIGFVFLIFGGTSGANPVIFIFPIVDTVVLALALFVLTAKYVVTVDAHSAGYRFGNRFVALKKSIPVTKPMYVSLEDKGTRVNNRAAPSIVVRNAEGASFDFGSLLDEDRKKFIAGRLVKLLKAQKRTPENPFASPAGKLFGSKFP